MQDEIYRYFNEGRPGLLIAEAPTGYGKTYETVQAMYRYVRSGGSRQILFATELIKNLPVQDLRQAYEADGKAELYDNEVLVLASPVDTVGKSIFDIEIPEEFQTPAYTALKAKYREMARFQKLQDCRDLMRHCQEELQSLEKVFRQEIEHRLKQEVHGGPPKRRDAIRDKKRYQWIADFYPAVFWPERKIILLTVKKLMTRNVSLVEPSFPCLSDRMLKGNILCIDEFDASKEVILNHLIDSALAVKADYLQLFRQVFHNAARHQISLELETAREQYEKGSHITWEKLAQQAEEIYQQGALFYSMKAVEQSDIHGRNFLFHDTSYHSVLDGSKTHIRAVQNDTAHLVELHFETQDVHTTHLDEPRISIQGLLRRIHSFLRSFQRYIYGWASCYVRQENRQRSETDEQFTLELAAETLFREYDLSPEQVRLMTGGLDIGSGRGSKPVFPDFSFYSSGFSLFEFIDDERHHSQTKLQYLQLQNTPENVLLYLCRRATVVGLSATAALPTVTGNYDLNYLHKKLGSDYHELSSAAQKRIAQELRAHWAPYQDGRIQVKLSVVDKGTAGTPVYERLVHIFEDEELARQYEWELGDNHYIQNRYCNIFTAMKAFWLHPDIHSFLCLNQLLPEANKPAFDLILLSRVFAELGRQAGTEVTDELVVLRSGNSFDHQKQDLLKGLSLGKRRFILSSYQTLGAGQNLQYSVQDRTGLISLSSSSDPNDSRLWHKDMDALYLGDVTHVVTQLQRTPPSPEADVLHYCFQVECLHENNELSAHILNRLLKDGISLRCSDREARAKMSNSPSIHRQLTRDVIQAVGRMSRTYQKRPTVYLFTTEKLLYALDPSCLQDRLLTPEMAALAQAREQAGHTWALPNTAKNEAERRANRGNQYIRQMLAYTWTQPKMELWKALRQTVLTHPTADQAAWDSDSIISTYYLSLPAGTRGYCFAQTGDFSDVQIALTTDQAPFRAQLSENYTPSLVSEEESRLSILLRYPGMRDYFEANGWATSFEAAPYILSPVLFQNIYKGALGEMAGRFILQQELGLTLAEITEPDRFEVFDFTLGNGIYLDFKHWKSGTSFPEQATRQKMLDKLTSLGGQCALVLNLFADEPSAGGSTADGRLVEIPGLLLPDGQLNRESIDVLRRLNL